MKTLLILWTLFFAIFTHAVAEPQLYVVVKELPNITTSDGERWDLEIGEVFPLVRWVSADEARGLAANPKDKTYALLQMDDLVIAVPSANIRLFEEKDMVSAAMTYRQIVQQSRVNRQAVEMPVAAGPGLSRTDRFKMLRLLRSANIISGIRANEHLSDAEIIRLMGLLKVKQEEQRLRDLESEVQRLRSQ